MLIFSFYFSLLISIDAAKILLFWNAGKQTPPQRCETFAAQTVTFFKGNNHTCLPNSRHAECGGVGGAVFALTEGSPFHDTVPDAGDLPPLNASPPLCGRFGCRCGPGRYRSGAQGFCRQSATRRPDGQTYHRHSLKSRQSRPPG